MHLVAVGGSDAGISAALRARELDPTTDVTVVVADAYPNFSICGIPYYISGEVTHWRNLAHRTHADLEATGMRLRLDTIATAIDVARAARRRPRPGRRHRRGSTTTSWSSAPAPSRSAHPSPASTSSAPPTACTCCTRWATPSPSPAPSTPSTRRTALIVGAGYVGLEMAEGLTARGLQVTQVEMLPEVLPTVDPELGALVHAELSRHGVDVHTRTTVTAITRTPTARPGCTSTAPAPTTNRAAGTSTSSSSWSASAPTPTCSSRAGATDRPARRRRRRRDHGHRPAARVGRRRLRRHPPPTARRSPTCRSAPPHTSRAASPARTPSAAPPASPAASAPRSSRSSTSSPPAPDCASTKPPPPATRPVTTQTAPDDHKAYYPGAAPITIRITGDLPTGRLLGAQLVGARGTETAKRVDTYATALFHGMTVDADQRPRPVLHPTARLALGRRPNRRPGLGPRPPPRSAASAPCAATGSPHDPARPWPDRCGRGRSPGWSRPRRRQHRRDHLGPDGRTPGATSLDNPVRH